MTEKFGISEKDELLLLKYWTEDIYDNVLKIPKALEGKITEEQATNVFSYYDDLGNGNGSSINTKAFEDRIKELETKFQKQKEQSFFFILIKKFKEQIAKVIVWVLIGFVLGFLSRSLLR